MHKITIHMQYRAYIVHYCSVFNSTENIGARLRIGCHIPILLLDMCYRNVWHICYHFQWSFRRCFLGLPTSKRNGFQDLSNRFDSYCFLERLSIARQFYIATKKNGWTLMFVCSFLSLEVAKINEFHVILIKVCCL